MLRLHRASFACGAQADVVVLRLQQPAASLRSSSRQVRLTLVMLGRGSVESDVPGIDCAAAA